MRFLDKCVLVTGAGAGIGQAAALKFAAEGAKVVCNSISNSAQSTVEKILQAGGEAIFAQGDVSSAEQAKSIVHSAIESYRKLDVLVNNAGIVYEGTLESTDEAAFRRTLEVNVIGTFLMSQCAASHMLLQGYGAIVNTASIAGLRGRTNRLAYASSKGAVIAMTKSLALELASKNIRVNCVCPGTIITPSLEERIDRTENPAAAYAEFCSRHPIGRLGMPEEIAEAILFAACNEAAFMTGSTIVIDGGSGI